MSEYREALARMTLAIQTNPMVLSDAVIATEYHAAKALLARGEPQCVDGLDGRGEMLDLAEKARALALRNDERRRLKLTSKQLMMEPEQFLAFVKYCESLEPAAAEHPAIDLVRKQACDAGLWFSPVTAAEAYLQQELRRLHAAIESQPAAAEKAREPMHEGFPVDTIVRDIFTDKVGTIVSYHCRFEVEWADGSNSMDVHSRQLDHCGPMPSPPASKVEAEKAREQTKAIDLPGYVKPDNTERVHFYEQEFYVLSNFSAFNVQWNRQIFATSEHAYHWAKFPPLTRDENGTYVRDAILNAPSAHEAFKLAERFKSLRRADWDTVKVEIMHQILRAKADQHEYVRRKLLQTGDRELVEDSWRDPFWGWGPQRDGQNMLGKLWMEIRAELRVLPSPPAATGPCEKCGGAGRLTIYEKSRPWQDGYPIGDEPCPQCAPAATGDEP